MNSRRVTLFCLGIVLGFVSLAQAETWQMKQRDQFHTGRADYTVPASRMNSSFFDVFQWQKPSPDSPVDGNFNGSSMPFFDGAGPGSSDIVVGTYHWPKGIQGMDRHTGQRFWYGNPHGGEFIAKMTPAFSNDGNTLYVVNNSTTIPVGPLMAFSTANGPASYRSNSGFIEGAWFNRGNPVIGSDGRIFGFSWDYLFCRVVDNGTTLTSNWYTDELLNPCMGDPSLYNNQLVGCGRSPYIRAYTLTLSDPFNVLWTVNTPDETDATPTIDPANGHIYVPVGMGNIYVVGLDSTGNPLWGTEPAMLVFEYQTEITEPQRAQSAGCLSYDGTTYYFQTVALDGSGKLYAINTLDGSKKWTYDTQSEGWEIYASSPVVTQNGVVLVGNNAGDTYYALQDNGQDDVALLDTLSVAAGSGALASPTLSSDGLLYLPLRTTWNVSNGDNDTPNGNVENVYCALNLQPLPVESWQMKQKDQYHTGRANFTVPANRMNNSFFDVFLWQKPSPNSPDEGSFNGSSMPFYDEVGPDQSDIVLGTYHWPKGVQGMNRHTGQTFWSGNPDGGEIIARVTPAFSSDGATIYVVNDWTGSSARMMAFATTNGPANFWGNQADPYPYHLEGASPVVCNNDGRIFSFAWDDRPYAASDTGEELTEVWAAPTANSMCYSNPALWSNDLDDEVIISAGRAPYIRAYDDFETEIWTVNIPGGTDATPTIDPVNGDIYVAVGLGDIFIVGLDINGNSLWSQTAIKVFDYEDGVNSQQRASAAGCLSYDGATYYFQTVAQDGTGQLYAVNTSDGSVKWTYDTQSKGWDGVYSCPIVTLNSVIIVGSNENDTYYAISDDGQNNPVLLDTLTIHTEGNAQASATCSSDGTLYLPLRTIWVAGNGDGQDPDYTVQNLFSALDLTSEAASQIYPPDKQRAVAGNASVKLKWSQVQDPMGTFDHYAIYRSTEPFTFVDGMTPIATVDTIDTLEYLDDTAENGTSYYYAITVVTTSGGEVKTINSVGPRTPRNETDLQVVSITRTPFYPRYCADYTGTLVTEVSGFGPYWTTAATGFCDGQDENTKRWPDVNETMTYFAVIRNRGTNVIYQSVTMTWEVDHSIISQTSEMIFLMPGETTSWYYEIPWDNESHDINFTIDIADDRPENNSLSSNTLAVGFLTYIDESFIEKFREEWSGNWPNTQTDDVIDWLNMHMNRFNQLFADADCQKRVHYDVLEVLDDTAEDPASPATINFAIFPFRYYYTDGDPRLSGYYHTNDDIDYGLLHEMGHQLGMIDVYQFDLGGEQNQVSGQGYSAHDDLMRGCSPFIAEFHAKAMNHWLKQPHGFYGQFLYNLPENIQLRLLDYEGQPLSGATVKIYQVCERDGVGKVITDQVKAEITTDENGICTLPNAPVDPAIIPPAATGDTLYDNPFGYVHVVGTNGVLLFRVEYEEGIDYCWLDITECCVAYWNGDTDTAVFDRQLVLGGPVMRIMPKDLAEMTAYDWVAWADGATASVEDDTTNKQAGAGSVKFITDGGFDTYLRYPKTYTALWDLSNATQLHIWFYAENTHGFQSESPWIRLKDANGNYFEYTYYENGYRSDFMNIANYNWSEAVIPLDGPFVDDGWNRTTHGTPDMTRIQMVEIHADTWDYGFNLWVDDVRFDWQEYQYCDFATDTMITTPDLEIMAAYWLQNNIEFAPSQGADLTQDKKVDLADFAIFAQSWLEGMPL